MGGKCKSGGGRSNNLSAQTVLMHTKVAGVIIQMLVYMYISSKNLTCRSCCSDNHWIALSSKGRHWSLSLLLHRAAAGVHAKVTPAPAV